MKEIVFVAAGFAVGQTYRAELYLNSVLRDTINNLVNGNSYEFTVTEPGTYTVRVVSNQDGVCVDSKIVQVLYPTFTFSSSSVDCDSNTYTFNVALTNPTTAGSNIQYGWSTFNDCATVSNWTSVGTIIIPADSTTRFVFIKNDNLTCCTLVGPTVKDPCSTCDLTISNIYFTCNG